VGGVRRGPRVSGLMSAEWRVGGGLLERAGAAVVTLESVPLLREGAA